VVPERMRIRKQRQPTGKLTRQLQAVSEFSFFVPSLFLKINGLV